MHRGDENPWQLVTVLAVLAILALLLPWIAPHDPLAVSIEGRLTPPDGAHWLGTDELGRDVLSRVLHGAALTVSVSIAALLTSLVIGVILGAGAGYFYNRWPDHVFRWVTDFTMAVPFIILIASVLSLTGPGVLKAYAVLAAIIWVSPARIVRAEVIKTLPLDYVLAERSIGTPEWQVLFFTVVPACFKTALIFSVGYLPEIIALEAGLSFLGLGVQPPHPGLGKMIFDGINFVSSAWWIAVSPAATLFLVVVGVQLAAWTTRSNSGNVER